jgi:uncharacterized membrane protein
MESRFRFFGHPIHQMLVVFPMGLLGGAAVFDVMALVQESGEMARTAYFLTSAGLIAGLAAAPFGFLDWLAIPRGTRAKTVGALHALGNVGVLAMFAGSWMLRSADPAVPGAVAQTLSIVAAVLAMVTGWLGGELVDRLGIGVTEGANADAPSSLRSEHPVAQRH